MYVPLPVLTHPTAWLPRATRMRRDVSTIGAIMRIAILGIRGVPANYGGFETFAEQLGKRLAERHHDVTVYGRDRWILRGTREYLGMRIIRLPAPKSKYLSLIHISEPT